MISSIRTKCAGWIPFLASSLHSCTSAAAYQGLIVNLSHCGLSCLLSCALPISSHSYPRCCMSGSACWLSDAGCHASHCITILHSADILALTQLALPVGTTGLADRHPPMPRLPLPAHVKAPHELGTLSGTFTELVQVSWHIKCNTFQDATLRQC